MHKRGGLLGLLKSGLNNKFHVVTGRPIRSFTTACKVSDNIGPLGWRADLDCVPVTDWLIANSHNFAN